MAELALVACAKTKASVAGPAAALYVSPLYRKSLLAALDRTKSVCILSAKHGLLDLGQRIEPYELTLKGMTAERRLAWGERVAAKLFERMRAGDKAVVYGGEDYVAPLLDPLRQCGVAVERPLGSRSLGARLQYLRDLNGEFELAAMHRRFSTLIGRLERAQSGGRLIRDCSGRLTWPERGVYIVLEELDPRERKRITRVGTHAVSQGSRTTLWDRISTHRGAGHGGGSHRSSIFRSHLGRALLRRGDLGAVSLSTWGVGQSAPADIRNAEATLERQVSAIVGGMKLLWLDVPDAPGPRSDRAYLERNIIGLLSRTNLLSPHSQPVVTWLGDLSDEWRIAVSGLWNLDHLFARPRPEFLDVLECYINATIGRTARIEQSIAPPGWKEAQATQDRAQLSLFRGEAEVDG